MGAKLIEFNGELDHIHLLGAVQHNFKQQFSYQY